MRARVIGVGQATAGDDAVGLAVVGALRQLELPGVEVCQVPEATALVALLDTDVPTILVDAVLGEPPGQVLELGVGELALRAPLRVSSHGLGVSEAIALAQTLNNTLPSVRVVAVTIAMPERYAQGMTAAVDAAVPRAVERVVSLLEVEHA